MGNPKTGKNRVVQRNIYAASGMTDGASYFTDAQSDDYGKHLIGYVTRLVTLGSASTFQTRLQFKDSGGTFRIADGAGVDVLGVTTTTSTAASESFFVYTQSPAGGMGPVPIFSDWRMNIIWDTDPGADSGIVIDAILLDEFAGS